MGGKLNEGNAEGSRGGSKNREGKRGGDEQNLVWGWGRRAEIGEW